MIPLDHLQLIRGILHSTLDQVDFVSHKPKAPFHLLLHGKDLLRDQTRQLRIRAWRLDGGRGSLHLLEFLLIDAWLHLNF